MKANPQSIPMTQPVHRLRGSLPKIGIRPIIDGRRKGVRESLEEQTMGLAKAAKAFLEANLRHSCGLPVECVIADTTIGGFKEAADCAEKFARENVGVSISVTPCWCYGSETMDMDPLTPKAVWASTARSARARCIWRRCWPRTRRRVCRPSASMATTCRTPATTRSRRRKGKAAAVRQGGPRGGGDARQVLHGHGFHRHGHRRLHAQSRSV